MRAEIQETFASRFEQTDSVIIFHMSKQCKKYPFGYASNDDDELIMVD